MTAKTASKIERGDPAVSIGTVFEAARLVGVDLYGDQAALAGDVAARELALLPRRGRTRTAARNDF